MPLLFPYRRIRTLQPIVSLGGRRAAPACVDPGQLDGAGRLRSPGRPSGHGGRRYRIPLGCRDARRHRSHERPCRPGCGDRWGGCHRTIRPGCASPFRRARASGLDGLGRLFGGRESAAARLCRCASVLRRSLPRQPGRSRVDRQRSLPRDLTAPLPCRAPAGLLTRRVRPRRRMAASTPDSESRATTLADERWTKRDDLGRNRAEIERLAAELDAALPPAGKGRRLPEPWGPRCAGKTLASGSGPGLTVGRAAAARREKLPSDSDPRCASLLQLLAWCAGMAGP